MPVVQYADLSKKTEISHFLSNCRQQATQTGKAKIASLTFPITHISPSKALSVLDRLNQRHFYYDRPNQGSLLGVGAAIDFCSAGPDRFEQADAFVSLWRSRVISRSFQDFSSEDSAPTFNQTVNQSSSQTEGISFPHKVHFFCSSTFFDKTETAFEPVYVFIPQVQIWSHREAAATFNYLVAADTDLEQIKLEILQRLTQLKSARSSNIKISASQRQVIRDVSGFALTVSAVLEQISDDKPQSNSSNKSLHKVVIADVMDVVADVPFDCGRSLQALRQNHPDCTIFSIGNGLGQSFIGASPERLLSIRENQITTDALAGSAPRGTTPNLDRQLGQTLLNSEKERYEHRVVVEFLLAQLRSLGLKPQYAAAPQLMRLFHIQHLHTPISADFACHLISPLEVLSRLHPTPAVAGTPRQQACQLIQQYETFDRGLYAAPLGWIDTDGNSEFIVGIRSALIDGRKARLYAGAGIVSGSQPDKELAEIKLKLQSLLNALH